MVVFNDISIFFIGQWWSVGQTVVPFDSCGDRWQDPVPGGAQQPNGRRGQDQVQLARNQDRFKKFAKVLLSLSFTLIDNPAKSR